MNALSRFKDSTASWTNDVFKGPKWWVALLLIPVYYIVTEAASMQGASLATGQRIDLAPR